MAGIFQNWLTKALGYARGNLHEGDIIRGLPMPGDDTIIETYQARGGRGQPVTSAGSFFGFFGRNFRFTPTPFNPDTLVQKKGLKIYRGMMIDEQVKAAVMAKKYAVLSTGYEIQLAQLPESEGAEADEVEEQKKFVEFNFDEMKGSFDGKLLDIMSALEFGFSVSEQIYHHIDYGEFDGKWGIKDIKTRPPEDMDFVIDAYGDLEKNGVMQFREALPTERFIIYSHDQQFGNYYGNSDLRAAYRAFWLKENMLKLMAVSLERYGEPIADISYDGILTEEQRSDLDLFLKNLQSRSGLVHHKGITLDFKTPPPRAAEAFIPAINLYDQHIRIAILMPGLVGLSGEAQVGSFARAVKEFDMFLWILGQLRKDIETVVNEQIIKPLIDLNYEVEHGQYPKFTFKELTEEARQKQYELFLMGLGAGALNKGPEDENKLRELINFEPLPEDFVPPQPMSPFGAAPADPNAANGNGGWGGGWDSGGGSQGSDTEDAADKSSADEEDDYNYARHNFSADQEAQLINYVQRLRKYHLPGQHDQQSHAGGREGSENKSGGGREPAKFVSTVEDAIAGILGGHVVEVKDTHTAYVAIDRLAQMSKEIKAMGKNAPTYDLCNVSVQGTNLFCAEGLKTNRFPNGIPRISMPQFGGVPTPGTKSETFPRNPYDKKAVDGSADFIKFVEDHGLKVTMSTMPVVNLRPAQRELIGPKVAAMAADKKFDVTKEPIFVSRDSFVIDGHHRWAAAVVRDMEDNKIGDITMNVRKVDAPISEIYFLAKRWARMTGVEAKGV